MQRYTNTFRRILLEIVIRFRNSTFLFLFSHKDLDLLFKRINARGDFVASYDLRADNREFRRLEFVNYDHGDTAIILQGPLGNDLSVLYRSIRNYLGFYSKARVIVSTWESSSMVDLTRFLGGLEEAQRLRCEVIVNSPPNFPGISNTNMQIISTRSGLLRAKELGMSFALKSRTDQTLLNLNALDKLKKALFQNVEKATGPFSQIVIGSRNTFLFRPYSYSDMLQFSTTDTLIEFWNVNLDLRKDLSLSQVVTPLDWSKLNMVEVYLSRSYLSRLGFDPQFNFRSHLEALTKYFKVVDSAAIGFLWNKYSYNQKSWSKLNFPYTTYEISEFDWEQIYENPERYFEFEEVCSWPWSIA